MITLLLLLLGFAAADEANKDYNKRNAKKIARKKKRNKWLNEEHDRWWRYQNGDPLY